MTYVSCSFGSFQYKLSLIMIQKCIRNIRWKRTILPKSYIVCKRFNDTMIKNNEHLLQKGVFKNERVVSF